MAPLTPMLGDKLTIVDTGHPITDGFKGDITVSNPAATTDDV